MSKPRVLFVSRTRYRLPLNPSLARKWDALGGELELCVLATSAGGRAAPVPLCSSAPRAGEICSERGLLAAPALSGSRVCCAVSTLTRS